MGKGKILIIDDSEAVLIAVAALLESEGFEVVEARTVWCSQLILRERPDLILVDVRMPGVPGDQAARVFTQSPGFLKEAGSTVLLHSHLPREDLARRAQESGAAGYIQKTSDTRAFIGEINLWLDRCRGPVPGAPS